MGEEETTELKLKLVQELAKNGCGPSDRYTQREEDRSISSYFLPSSSSFPQVPIVNLHRLFNDDDDEAHKLGSVVQSWGLFQAIGHDLSPSLLDEVQDVSRKFFQLPLEVKQKYSNLKSGKFELEGYGNDRVATKEQIIGWNDRLYLLVQPEDKRKLEWWPENPSSFSKLDVMVLIPNLSLNELNVDADNEQWNFQEPCSQGGGKFQGEDIYSYVLFARTRKDFGTIRTLGERVTTKFVQ